MKIVCNYGAKKMATFSLQGIMRCPKFQKLPLSIVFEWCKLEKNSKKAPGPGPSPDWVSLPVLSPPHTVLWIRGSPRGPLTLTLPKTPSTRLWTEAAALALFSWEARGGTRPGSVLALEPLYWAVPSKAFRWRCVAGMAEQGTLEAPGS